MKEDLLQEENKKRENREEKKKIGEEGVVEIKGRGCREAIKEMPESVYRTSKGGNHWSEKR